MVVLVVVLVVVVDVDVLVVVDVVLDVVVVGLVVGVTPFAVWQAPTNTKDTTMALSFRMLLPRWANMTFSC